MANQEQLEILKQSVEAWNLWSAQFILSAELGEAELHGANLSRANLRLANLRGADLTEAELRYADLSGADLRGTNLGAANLREADLTNAVLVGTHLDRAQFGEAIISHTVLGDIDLGITEGLEEVFYYGPSLLSTSTIQLSKGKISVACLRGCGLSDWEIETVKLFNPDLSNEEINQSLYKMYELRATQALQISPLFISYSHGDNEFVNKIGDSLTEKGIRYWRDIHEMKAGRMEKQIDLAIRQNPTVLLMLSEHSLSSDWVEHEVRIARGLEKDMGRDVLCPLALDDSWKSSPWPKRVMEQIMEYNILDFSAWKDDTKFGDMFRKLIDGLELFYKG